VQRVAGRRADTMQPSRDIRTLIKIVAALRQPESGCPGDKKQTFEAIVPYTIEEAYEIADAVARGDMIDLKEELGDLLLQVAIQSRIAEERGCFDFGAVVEAVTEKMIRRRPHVFEKAREFSPGNLKTLWNAIKAEEKAAKAQAKGRQYRGGGEAMPGSGLLHEVPAALPGLTGKSCHSGL
jgi:nucleoside triphosphate diphosphatase